MRLSLHQDTATHQLRVRMKKMLALLRLAREAIEEQTMLAMRLHIRAVKNACAGDRDRLVQSKLIDKLARRFHLHPKNRAERSLHVQTTPPASFLQHQLHALSQLISRSHIQSLDASQILVQHAGCYRRGRRLMKQSFESTNRHVLHRWRHRVKDLYYQTLVLSYLPGAARRIRRARRLGQLLGRDQDFANLAREPAYSMRRGPWLQLIDEHRSNLRERFLSLGHRLYAPQSSRFSCKIRTAA